MTPPCPRRCARATCRRRRRGRSSRWSRRTARRRSSRACWARTTFPTFCWLPACSIAWACRSRRSRANCRHRSGRWPAADRGTLAVQAAGARGPLVVVDYAHTLTRWRARSPRCGQWRTPARAGWSACSAAAAIAIRASVPSWAASRRNWLTAWWCPATIRATKCPRTSSGRSWPACRFGGRRGAGRPRPRHHADRLGLRAGRRAAAGWQGS